MPGDGSTNNCNDKSGTLHRGVAPGARGGDTMVAGVLLEALADLFGPIAWAELQDEPG